MAGGPPIPRSAEMQGPGLPPSALAALGRRHPSLLLANLPGRTLRADEDALVEARRRFLHFGPGSLSRVVWMNGSGPRDLRSGEHDMNTDAELADAPRARSRSPRQSGASATAESGGPPEAEPIAAESQMLPIRLPTLGAESQQTDSQEFSSSGGQAESSVDSQATEPPRLDPNCVDPSRCWSLNECVCGEATRLARIREAVVRRRQRREREAAAQEAASGALRHPTGTE
jgi:hypothetical protein